MLNCEQATRLQSESMERPLSLKEKVELKLHTAMCNACRRFGRQVGSLRDMSRQYRDQQDNNSD
ncbi:hypothetical protein CHH28_04510 [Bacterioplanes sanyensis]|uniref:Putative zinc-finger domain-containing protein n=1 Tax=Bacterioplanes sanyensis TaxID=1249553 RepID=A0A222FHC9_9GAMM|nr:hypothetical protein [Bacterioplanes sanyensis]ASP37986.1 hypothetical protein CHH28_04510 [Bacterioplanes sanyensis]